MDVYLVGFHPMKEHPEQQMEAHHCVIEWAFTNLVSLEKFQAVIAGPRYGKRFTKKASR